VADISEALAVELGWNADRWARLREAALLHDVGKIGVPDAVLNKPAMQSCRLERRGQYTRSRL